MHTHRVRLPQRSDQHVSEAAAYTTWNKQRRQTFMTSAGNKPSTPAIKGLWTHNLNCTATRTGSFFYGGIVGLCWIDNYNTTHTHTHTHTHIYIYILMSKVVIQSDKWGRCLLAVILSSAVEWYWPRCRAALPCLDVVSGRPRAMMNRWSRGWLAGGPRWNWGGCDWCWWATAGCPGWAVVCPVHEATWSGSRASGLLSWCV